MGYDRVTWIPGRERRRLAPASHRHLKTLRQQHQQRALEATAALALQGELVSLVALLGSKVSYPDGRSVGLLRDVIVHWTARTPHPAVKAIVVRAGRREVLIGARWVEISPPGQVRLRSGRALAREVERHPADLALAHDVLDRQVVDSEGIQIVRPADLYLVAVGDRVELVGAEVGVKALVRRLGPRRLQRRVRPDRVIDWASISGFMPTHSDDSRRAGRRSDLAGRSGTELGLAQPAIDVRRLRPSDIEAVLRASAPPNGNGSA